MPPNVDDWRIAVIQAHEHLFDLMSNKPERALRYPPCDTGCRDILEEPSIRVEPAPQETFKFVCVTQKFGEVWTDWHGGTPDKTRAEVLNTIDLTVARPCEVCDVEARPLEAGFENFRIFREAIGKPGMFCARYYRETDALPEVSPNAFELEE
jgi:hypothetical protein